MSRTPASDERPGRTSHERNSLTFDALLGLGSNVGDKAGNIVSAISRLTAHPDIVLVRQSRLYRSPPWGVTEQDWFVNAAISIATAVSPHALLARCQAVEHEMGRVRRERWGPRVIDIDILTYRDQTVNDSDLVIPHPRIAERAFVLVPMQEIAPHARIGSRSIDDLLASVDASQIIAMP